VSQITHLLIVQLAIATAPFAVWGLVVIAAQIWGARVRGIVPWLHMLSLAVWGIALLIVLIAIFSGYHLWLMPCAGITASSGFILGKVELWVKQRYAPELLAESEGRFQLP
jgi:hypothetical protein